jgi:hypothetical protein
MHKIIITGRVEEAEGGAIFITIAGPDHYSFSDSYTGSFHLPLSMSKGRYDIIVSAHTTGTFTLDVEGEFSAIEPAVPHKFETPRQPFTLIV